MTLSSSRETLARLAVFGVLFLGLHSSAVAGGWYVSARRLSPQSDSVAPLLQGPRCIRQALPGSGTVGYFTDPDGDVQVGEWHAGRRYFLTAYELAPNVVQMGPINEWIIGDLGAADVDEVALRLGLEPVRRCPGGMVLFQAP